MHRHLLPTLLPLLSLGLLVAACDSVCPAGHDPDANPLGDACSTHGQCRIECVCIDADDEKDGVIVGECISGACVDADQLCATSCGALTYSGAFCAAD